MLASWSKASLAVHDFKRVKKKIGALLSQNHKCKHHALNQCRISHTRTSPRTPSVSSHTMPLKSMESWINAFLVTIFSPWAAQKNKYASLHTKEKHTTKHVLALTRENINLRFLTRFHAIRCMYPCISLCFFNNGRKRHDGAVDCHFRNSWSNFMAENMV
jgi:hypothetical protein